MALIAVAGGSSPSLGRVIVQAIKAGKNIPIILSRSSKSNASKGECYGAEVRYVDYSSQDSLIQALKGIETIICVLKIAGPEWSTVQLNLLKAAEVAGVKRFAPAEFGLGQQARGRYCIEGCCLESLRRKQSRVHSILLWRIHELPCYRHSKNGFTAGSNGQAIHMECTRLHGRATCQKQWYLSSNHSD